MAIIGKPAKKKPAIENIPLLATKFNFFCLLSVMVK
jgi:hypothetical protein